jgi:predicted nuclease of predicted toxin-antitoxin system
MRGHRRIWLFLIDGNLPPSLGDVFRANGHDAVHLLDLGMQRAADIEIWRQAHSNRAVIVTKDKDFASLAISRADVCPVILVRIGNVRRAACWPSLGLRCTTYWLLSTKVNCLLNLLKSRQG